MLKVVIYHSGRFGGKHCNYIKHTLKVDDLNLSTCSFSLYGTL